MRSTFALTALLFLAAADPRQPLLGHWTGTSICTAVRPVLSGFVGGNNPATFTWSGDTMTGTFKQHDGQVIRNIRLSKQPK